MTNEKAIEKVKLRHPHTGDEVEVDGTAAALVPYMVQGYAQVAANAEKPAVAAAIPPAPKVGE